MLPLPCKPGKNALPGILAEEEKWADEANRQRWLARADIAGVFFFRSWSHGSLFLLWRKITANLYLTEFDGSYYRELPCQLQPGGAGCTMEHRKLKARDFTATIMDLARASSC